MRLKLILLGMLLFSGLWYSYSQTKTIHVFVALCDNANQGIVPVPEALGNGQDPKCNLYWGAMYGLKSFFKRSADWTLLSVATTPGEIVLERLLFKHRTQEVYLLADAYDGAHIKTSITHFLEANAGQFEASYKHGEQTLKFGGESELLAYIGHDGLMEFEVTGAFTTANTKCRQSIMLACVSRAYFKPYIEMTGAEPLLWTTGLMAPEAYTLEAAIDGWLRNESGEAIRSRAAKAYHKYQNCGLKAAKRLLVSGY